MTRAIKIPKGGEKTFIRESHYIKEGEAYMEEFMCMLVTFSSGKYIHLSRQ